jgi:hypothetical protein
MDREYQELLDAYVEDLRAARDVAVAWWNDLIRPPPGTPADAAYTQARLLWPAGPVSYPRVIAVYRQYYLACEALNEKREAERAQQQPAGWGQDDDDEDGGSRIVPPRALLIDSLEAIDPDLDEFMRGFVFSPMGTDEDGRTA